MSGPVGAVDPFASAGHGYVDDVVEVRALRGDPPRRTRGMVRTAHFDVLHAEDHRIRVGHRVGPDEMHGGLAQVLADELFGPGWLRGSDLFERIFTGVVVSSAPDPLAGWEWFYRNTLAQLEDPAVDPTGLAAVHRHATGLVGPGSVLELGCCFGFLGLRLAASGRPTTVSDLSAGTVELVAAMARRLDLPVGTLVADAARVPAPDGYADTVLVLHLLEHLEPEHGDLVLAEAVRLARRRVVVAVPLESVPEETWGHVRTISLADLADWGRRTGHPCEVHEHHGGWLIVDTRPVG